MEGEGVKYTNKKPKKCLKCVLYSWKKNLNNESKFVRSWKDCFCSLISRFNAVKINKKIFSCALFRHTFYAFFAKFFLSELKPFAAFVILHVIHSDLVFYHKMSHNFVQRCYFKASVFSRKKTTTTIYLKLSIILSSMSTFIFQIFSIISLMLPIVHITIQCSSVTWLYGEVLTKSLSYRNLSLQTFFYKSHTYELSYIDCFM